jgi:hypothetical protein
VSIFIVLLRPRNETMKIDSDPNYEALWFEMFKHGKPPQAAV